MQPPAVDITFRETTPSGTILSPPQRRPPPRSAQSIARVFICNMMCRVGRSSSLRLWLHSNVMEAPSPLSAGWFFSPVSAALPPASRSRTIVLNKSHLTQLTVLRQRFCSGTSALTTVSCKHQRALMTWHGGCDKWAARYHHVLQQPAMAAPQGQTTHKVWMRIALKFFLVHHTHAHNLPAAESCAGNTSAPVCVLKAVALEALRAADCFACVTSHYLATARREAPAVKRATYSGKILIRGRRSRFSEVTRPIWCLEGLPATAETLIVIVLVNWIWNESVRQLVSSSFCFLL